MLRMLTNTAKAVIAVAASPVAVVADLVSLPSTAYSGKPPFGKTEALLSNAGASMKEATKALKEQS